MVEVINYQPPPTVDAFITDHRPGALFYDWIVGPIGSGKTTGIFMKLAYMAKLQERGPDGVRRTRAVIVRNTNPQLKDTTLKSWNGWFKDGVAGKWFATEKNFLLKFDDVECEVLFRPLDSEEDVARVLSLEVTFAILDEFVEIPRAIMEALSGRCGRYPAEKDGGPTNWGMWGASNPSTEDNWWYDYLHNSGAFAEPGQSADVQEIQLYGLPEHVHAAHATLGEPPPGNVRYFHQPAGNGPYAENIENLPGKAEYYVNNAKGKSPAWVKQFIEALWGFSASETPVVKTFNSSLHVQKMGLRYSPHYQLVIGLDPGLGGLAAVMGQEDLYGRLLVLGELTASGMGVTRFISDRLKPYLKLYFPHADVLIAPDPASANKQQTDERAVVDVLRKHFPVKIETNNRLAKRLDAIESYTMHLTEMGPGLQIDGPRCPELSRALAGGWRFQKMTRQDTMRPEPEKNKHSHIGDAFGYLCRHFHRQFEREGTRGMTVSEVRRPPARQVRVPQYHFR